MDEDSKAYFIFWVVSVFIVLLIGMWIGVDSSHKVHQQEMDTLRRSVNQTQPEYIRASTQSCIHTAVQQLQRCEELSRSMR